MAVSRRVALCGLTAGAVLLTAPVMTPVLAGGATVAVGVAGGHTATARVDAQWGSGATGGAVVAIVPVPTSDTGRTVTVTVTDNMGTVDLRVGDTLVVSLPSMYVPPTVAPSGVLVEQDVVGGYPTGQPLVARYVAVAPGGAEIATISDALCRHQPTPCPSPQVPWRVNVTVTA
jgi:hypothetical protein